MTTAQTQPIAKCYAHINSSNNFFITNEEGYEEGYVFLGSFPNRAEALERVQALIRCKFLSETRWEKKK